MLTTIVLAVFGVLLLFPQTSAARALRRLLVEIPAERLDRVRRGHVMLAVMVGLGAAVALMFGREALMIFGQGGPELIAWFAAFDIATYVDVIAVALVVAASVQLRSAAAFVRTALGGLRRRRSGAGRGVRTAPRRKAPPADSEGEPWPAARLAAA